MPRVSARTATVPTSASASATTKAALNVKAAGCGDDIAGHDRGEQTEGVADEDDILVNNAAAPGGTVPSAKIEQVTGANLLFDVNVKVAGYLRSARAVAPHLVKMVGVASSTSAAPRRTGNYIASGRNVAVSSLTKNLTDELGPKGINVVAIHPGTTPPERTIDPAAETRLRAAVSIGRLVDATEIAYLVAFLASPKSVAINGETIAVVGGMLGSLNY